MENKITILIENHKADEQTLYLLWLQKQYTNICKRNSRYSLRAFEKNIIYFCEKLLTSARDLKQFRLIVNFCALQEDGDQTIAYILGIQLYQISTLSENL